MLSMARTGLDLPRAYFVWAIKEAWQQVKEEAKAAAGFR
jgi:hypothetical protein